MKLRKRCTKLEKVKKELERKNSSLSDSLSKMSCIYTDDSKVVSVLDQAFLTFIESHDEIQKEIDDIKENCVMEDEDRTELNFQREIQEVESKYNLQKQQLDTFTNPEIEAN